MKKTKLNVYIEIKENRFLNYLCSKQENCEKIKLCLTDIILFKLKFKALKLHNEMNDRKKYQINDSK